MVHTTVFISVEIPVNNAVIQTFCILWIHNSHLPEWFWNINCFRNFFPAIAFCIFFTIHNCLKTIYTIAVAGFFIASSVFVKEITKRCFCGCSCWIFKHYSKRWICFCKKRGNAAISIELLQQTFYFFFFPGKKSLSVWWAFKQQKKERNTNEIPNLLFCFFHFGKLQKENNGRDDCQ